MKPDHRLVYGSGNNFAQPISASDLTHRMLISLTHLVTKFEINLTFHPFSAPFLADSSKSLDLCDLDLPSFRDLIFYYLEIKCTVHSVVGQDMAVAEVSLTVYLSTNV